MVHFKHRMLAADLTAIPSHTIATAGCFTMPYNSQVININWAVQKRVKLLKKDYHSLGVTQEESLETDLQ